MKTKKGLKRIAALIMCVVLLATSLPIALAANGAYNPAPYFTQEAQEKGAAAWLDEGGNLQIRFPAAVGRPTHAVWSKNPNETVDVKEIDYYIVEVSDLGGKLEKHNTQPPVLLSKKVWASDIMALAEGDTLYAVFTADEIGDLLNVEDNRYNVAITAVDKAGWFSLSMHALVSDVPEYVYDADAYKPLVEHEHAMREVMRFEGRASESNYSTNGAGGGSRDLRQVGDSITTLGRAEQAGTENPETGVDTYGYAIRIESAPQEGVGQSFDTAWSRETWDFSGAEEVWFWMDLSQVELKGLSFRLRANEKKITTRNEKAANDTVNETEDKYGDTVYSTLGTKFNTYEAGQEPYVLIQQTDGSWKKVLLQNGTIDLGHFRGYIRIPLQYICAETDSVVTSSNQEIDKQSRPIYGSGINNDDKKERLDAWINEVMTLPSVVVNYAGTPIADSLLIQERKIFQDGWGTKSWNVEMGKMLAAAIDTNDDSSVGATPILDPNDPKRAKVVSDGNGGYTVENRENGYKAIEDIMSAGFAYTSLGEDSVNKGIFLDNIVFYRMDDKEYPSASINGVARTGLPVSTYYDQKAEIQLIILDTIDTYIDAPNWTDYRAVHYIEDLVNGYRQAFTAAGLDTAFLTNDSIAAKAESLGRSRTWQKYLTAYEECDKNGTLQSNNSMADDLVPMLVQQLELLPDPSTVISVSDKLQEMVIKLYQAYTRLNYAQLKMLGSYTTTDADGKVTASFEEAKLLAYVELLGDKLQNEFVTGTRLANLPYIVFNDFEKNTTVNKRVPQLENDPNFAGANDYRHNTGTFTYSTGADNFIQVDNGVNANFSLYRNTAWASITNNGFKGSRGAEITIDSSFNTGTNEPSKGSGVWHAISFARNSQSAEDFAKFRANNMQSDNLGGLAKTGGSDVPLALVFYVDFSEMENFAFAVNVYTEVGGKQIKARPDFGNNEGDQKYYLLDPDTGIWTMVHTGDRYSFKSTGISGDTIKLDHYKGYLMVPLYHLKFGTTVIGGQTIANSKLDESTEALNNIYAINFGVTDMSGSNDEKSYVIDNVGFTYSPEHYADKLAGRTDSTYAELFNAKSTAAADFENYVSAIDPFSTNLVNEVATAQEMYTALGEYQKLYVETVKQAKALLDTYQSYVDQTARPKAPVLMPNELKTAIANLPEKAKTFNVADNLLPYPGYNAAASALEAGTVNYAAFGFEDADPYAQAQAIAAYYTDSYRRYSEAQLNMITAEEKTQMLNAYNAAMRCIGSLEVTRTEAINFSGEMVSLYKPYYDYDGGERRTLIKATDRDTVSTLSAVKYDPLPYYAKSGLSDGSIIQAYANMTDGLSRYLANTNKVNVDGEEITGGVYRLMDQYTALYDTIRTELAAKRTLSPELVAQLKETVAEYNDLLPAYKNVFELYYGSEQADASGEYQGIKDIMELFLQTDVAFADGTTETTLALTEDNIDTESKTLNVNYLEEYPVETGADSATYFTFEGYDGYLKSGTTMRTYQLMLNGNTLPTVGVDEAPVQLDAKLLGDTLKNNTYTADAPFEMVFTAKLTDKAPFAEQLSDKITLKHYRPADPEKGETEPQLLGTYILNITYMPGEAYMVSIPAEFPVDWGTAETDVSYSVDCVLKEGSKIAVNVAGAGQLTAVKDASLVMNYTAQDFATTEFRGVQSKVKPTALPMVVINPTTWNTVPVGEYRDTLTYTVEYTPAP